MADEWQIDSLRPLTQYCGEMDGMLNAMRSFQVNDVSYVACPITGGNRHVQWVRESATNRPGSHRFCVIEPNIASADSFCARVAELSGCVCINPATLYRSHWSQDDYRHFWSRVIEEFACRMYLSEGWEVSVGCLFECLLAMRLGLPVYDHKLTTIRRETTICLALEGARVLEEIGDGSEFLTALTNEFLQLGSGEYSNESTKR